MKHRNYTSKNFTWGCELEAGDIPRKTKIPKSLGSWEYAETDIVNLNPPYQFVACDPQGLCPPVGGEINVYPTKQWEDQLAKVGRLKKLFPMATSNCISHTHIHVGVRGLTNDVSALKRLTKYIIANQEDTVRLCLQYDRHKCGNLGRGYMKLDGGRLMPAWMGANLVKHTTNFGDFIRIQCCGKDAVSRGRPFRYAINTYCLKWTGTVEFRCFRHTLSLIRIGSCFDFVEQFMLNALNDGDSVVDIVAKHQYYFPPFRYVREQVEGWHETKWDKSRGKKERKRVEVR